MLFRSLRHLSLHINPLLVICMDESNYFSPEISDIVFILKDMVCVDSMVLEVSNEGVGAQRIRNESRRYLLDYV